MHTTAVIVQSNYLPWKGYFDLMRQADVFVLYDDVQYTRRDWRNRNVIKTPQGLHWLTVPVQSKGQYHQDIDKITVSSSRWIEKHWNTIAMSYGKSPGFFRVRTGRAVHDACVRRPYAVIGNQWPANPGRGGTPWHPHAHRPVIRLWEGFRKNGKPHPSLQGRRRDPISVGACGRSYLDAGLFSHAGIELSYMDYSGYPEYGQPHGPFTHFVSIVDLLMSTGEKAASYLIQQESSRVS